MTTSSLKILFKKSILLQCTVRIIYNFLKHIQYYLGRISTDSGATHSQLSIADSLDYINAVFEDYKKYAGISHFHGHVCELGPGDNSGVALKILADGAHQVDLADRFYSNRNAASHAQIYQALTSSDPQIAARLNTADLEDETTFPGVTRFYGAQASGESFFKTRLEVYDFIISRSVLEHVTDPYLTLESMYQALKPGGMLIHKVDLRDHGMFTPRHHDLKFLEIPSLVYQAMTYDSGLPNRCLINAYRSCVFRLNATSQFLVTQLAYVGPVDPHLPFDKIPLKSREAALAELGKHKKNFAHSLQKISDNDLIVAGFFLILRKPS
jgi:SAM-dependent methyltransferase